jgi:integrase
VLVRAGLPRLRLHTLRHQYASLLIAQGAKYISETMGHSSIRVTFDVYGHLFARTRQQASACLEAALLSSPLAPSDSAVTPEEFKPLPIRP